MWDELGGLDERFELPGGGLVNHDLYRRACDLPGAELVVLLGEGTFHQYHGGAATSRRLTWDDMHDGVPAVRGDRTSPPERIRPLRRRGVPASLPPIERSARQATTGCRARRVDGPDRYHAGSWTGGGVPHRRARRSRRQGRGSVVPKAPIAITGMHRSGTSMITRALHDSGLHLIGTGAEELIDPAEDNPEGFWENKAIVACNDELLEATGGCVGQPARPPAPGRRRPAGRPPRRRQHAALAGLRASTSTGGSRTRAPA